MKIMTPFSKDTTTIAQAMETYRRTILDDDRYSWPSWVIAVHNSLVCREWIGSETLPPYAKEVWDNLMEDGTIAHSK